MNDRHTELEAGALIADRFRVGAPIGRGGMGIVYRARQLTLGRDVALKVMLPRYAERQDQLDRFEREARSASALQHPNAVAIYDFGVHEKRAFLAMELLEGTSLRAEVDYDRPPPPLERAAWIAATVADVLVAAHAMGLVHRDIKPENIFLAVDSEANERVVVLDFGLAYIEGDPRAGRLTQDGAAAGTPDYLAPEQADGNPCPASDIYALGCCLYEMLTGTPPFDGTVQHLLAQHAYTTPVSPSERRRDLSIPAELDELAVGMLRKKPEQRPTARDVRDELRRFGTDRRGRGRERLDGRAARMLSSRPGPPDAHAGSRETTDVRHTSPRADAVQLAVIGALEGDLALGLAASGVQAYIVTPEQAVAGADAIYAPGASAAVLESLRSHGIPVLSDAAPGALDRVTELLRAGVREVLMTPVNADDLARKTWRAARARKKTPETNQ